jgi:hypothetical protein
MASPTLPLGLCVSTITLARGLLGKSFLAADLQLGTPLLAPRGLHPGVHHRARASRQDPPRDDQAQREGVLFFYSPLLCNNK